MTGRTDAAGASAAAIDRLFRRSGAATWGLSPDAFATAVQRSVAKRFGGAPPAAGTVDAFVETLHAEDLALACACADGVAEAWDHFVLTFRPDLYRAARALVSDESTGRELADSLHADLFGLSVKDGERRSLFRYYHGRAKLSTWLRSVLAQRRVDLARSARRTTSIDDPDHTVEHVLPAVTPDAARLETMRRAALAVTAAVAALGPADRLRLAYYYVHDMTLTQIGRLVGEHEATVSRKLDRARKGLRAEIRLHLERSGVNEADVEDWAEVARSAWDAALADALAVAPQGPAVPPFKEQRSP